MHSTVLITGGTGTLGRSLVEVFYERGYQVIFTGTKETAANKLIDDLNKKSSGNFEPIFYCIDFFQENALKDLSDFLSSIKVNIQILINNARSLNYLNLVDHLPSRDCWLKEYTMDVVVPYELSLSLLRLNHPLKSIVNIASIYGIVAPRPGIYKNAGTDSPVQYSVAKAAQIHMSKELAIRLVDKNVRVNSISPAGFGSMPNEFKENYLRHCPQNRVLGISEIANAVVFLAEDSASGITGHNLVVDGGWTVW